MDLYYDTSSKISKLVTESYSTSFSMASRLFHPSIRSEIYNIYGFVRLADEIVDSYKGEDKLSVLNEFEDQVIRDIEREYSTNPVIHAFVITCRNYLIDIDLIVSFLKSMRIDAIEGEYTPDRYMEYIYGSAEVVGLMCLKVFCNRDINKFNELREGAKALGSAFQKVNFLRDISEDFNNLGRYYFPIGSYDSFDDSIKQSITEDIKADFLHARNAIPNLPSSSRSAVIAAYDYYLKLLTAIEDTDAKDLMSRRIRVANWQKILLLIRSRLTK